MVSRLERLLSLLNVLIGAERPIQAERIRARVPGYPSETANFQRQFERDKATLRDMGLEVETSDVPGAYPPVIGYRIARDQAHLSDPGLDPDELAALHLATAAVRLDGIEGSGALWKLGGGARTSGEGGIVDLPADERLIELFRAVTDRRTVTFTYREVQREVEPWRLSCARGRWYLTGLDRSVDEQRAFRLDRFEGPVRAGAAGAFARPEGAVSGVRMEPWQFGAGEPVTATLLVDADHLAEVLQAAPSARLVERTADGSARLELDVTDPEAFRGFVLSLLHHAEVIGPEHLRSMVVAWLQDIVGSVER